MENPFDTLRKIKQIEAPPFLFTRIQAGLRQKDNAPAAWKWAFALIALLLLACNLAVILHSSTSHRQTQPVTAVVNTLHLSPSNDLYHE
jgi:hypothetical protein